MPVLRNLYAHVKDDLPKKGQRTKKSEAAAAGTTVKELPPRLPSLVKGALDQFYSHYQEYYDGIRKNAEEKLNIFSAPPVFIAVCNNTSVSKEMYKYNVDELFGNALDKDELEKVSEYYEHQDGWTNRLIQGDSHLVMASLLEREGMAVQVQTIYLDPPYGIKYGSNWQVKLNNRDVKDGNDESLASEPEVIKAFRDTWELGIHSYLSYLRDRLLIARELLTESGSCFVQISDQNLHLVRNLMDEVFGSENFVRIVSFQKQVAKNHGLYLVL